MLLHPSFPSRNLLRRRPRQSLMQMRREPVPQLTRIRRQIQNHLLQLLHHHLPGALVAAKLAIDQLLSLPDAADDGPHNQIRHVDRDWLREAGEFGSVGSDCAGIAARLERENIQATDFLVKNVLALGTICRTIDLKLTSRH